MTEELKEECNHEWVVDKDKNVYCEKCKMTSEEFNSITYTCEICHKETSILFGGWCADCKEWLSNGSEE